MPHKEVGQAGQLKTWPLTQTRGIQKCASPQKTLSPSLSAAISGNATAFAKSIAD
jgi:hypothetical protein